MLPGVTRFFLFRGINDPSSRDIGGLFNWQSTILNLISFLIIGLFAYCAASYYDLIPSGISGIIFWLISVGIIIICCYFTTYCMCYNRQYKRRERSISGNICLVFTSLTGSVHLFFLSLLF